MEKRANIALKVIVDGEEKLTACSPGDSGVIEISWTEVDSDKLLKLPLVLKDFVKAVKGVRPTISVDNIKRSEE